jgi:hypothetical protein
MDICFELVSVRYPRETHRLGKLFCASLTRLQAVLGLYLVDT